MDTNALKKFAQSARNQLIDQVTARLDMVLAEGAAARREHPKAIARLEAAAKSNRGQVIEQAAYRWFNRFTALRFMDVTGLTNPRVVSPADGAVRPEILAEAMAGNLPDRARPEIAEYLNGTRPAHDGQAEAYRLLLIHACNEWHSAMPYMFERADMLDRAEDYTELLMPDDLLSPDSILARLRELMTEDACQDVEIIGWLYQFYISEKKDQVFAGLKKNVKITAENIPAATQLFTPHWIVRYLVENSLGRLWLLNRPQSKLVAKMGYYIAPEGPETDFLKITRPEEIRICDPACGSGHMLTYAFDLLYEIYAEEGHDAAEIPGLILKHNLTGIEIDDRAGALAAFALAMKASAKLGRRRFLRMEAKPDIVVLQDVRFTPAEMQEVVGVVGKDLFTDELGETLSQFEQAKNLGSLIVPKLLDPAEALRAVQARDFGSDLLLKDLRDRVVGVLRMAEALRSKYHVAIANPPYMGAPGMNGELGGFVKAQYPDSKSDLFAVFMERSLGLCINRGLMAMINMQSWMFLSSYEKLRGRLLSDSMILSMAHLGERAFDSIGGAVVSTTAFVIENAHSANHAGAFFRLVNGRSEAEKEAQLREAIKNPNCGWFYRVSTEVFKKMPGSPIAFWLPSAATDSFAVYAAIGDSFDVRSGITTGDNGTYILNWTEIDVNLIVYGDSNLNQFYSPHNKGGDYRKWYGNFENVLKYGHNNIVKMEELPGFRHDGVQYFYRSMIGWGKISSEKSSFRYYPEGFSFNTAGLAIFNRDESEDCRYSILGFLNSNVGEYFLKILNPTMNVSPGVVSKMPFNNTPTLSIVPQSINLAQSDWDAFETSRDFTTLPLLSPDHRRETMGATYADLRAHWQGMTDEMQRLEEENNRIFIDAYGLQDELTPEVPIDDITLTCNPAYRYGIKSAEEDREARLREDTVAEFLHYAVGCMFGRYSLDAPGLILANQGEGPKEYLARVPEPSFAPDRDNVIPVLDADWFADDIVTRTRDFLRVTFGEAKFRENLSFIEAALGKELRKWFTKDFFDYHVRRYKKRPIYWMFSSPKGSFNALIYMHRYRPDTVSVVLNQYLRELIHKLEVERARLEKLADDPNATQSARTKAQKDIGTVIKQISELTEWERDVVYPMAQQKIAIDLDDGVKRNYPLFAGALKPIKGLETADD